MVSGTFFLSGQRFRTVRAGGRCGVALWRGLNRRLRSAASPLALRHGDADGGCGIYGNGEGRERGDEVRREARADIGGAIRSFLVVLVLARGHVWGGGERKRCKRARRGGNRKVAR